MKKCYFKPSGYILPGMIALASLQVQAQTIFGITENNSLTSFSAASPGQVSSPLPVTGLVSGQVIAGMDFRPNTGQLYILGYNSTDSSANLYTVNKTTAAATRIGTSTLKLALGNGSKVGFDFNPTVDRIRVVAGTDVSYRLHPVTGALAFTDGALKFAASDVNAGKNPNSAACAYTNSYIGAGTTTLYNYDDSLNVITRQDPPNDGILNTIGSTGIIALTPSAAVGFDIYKNPSTLESTAYLSYSAIGSSGLFSLDINTGTATPIGTIGSSLVVKDIAVEIDRTLPEVTTGNTIYAIQGASNLISFNSENTKTIRSLVAITGIATGQTIAGMDARPLTKELFVLGYNAANGESQLYSLNPVTGVAIPVGTSPFTLALGSGPIGLDFNPTVDRIRVVGSNNNNFRLNPVTGGIAAVDTALAFALTDVNAGKDPFISSVAYTNSFNGATATQLIGYDDSLDVFVLQSPPNRGTLNTLSSPGFQVNLADASSDIDIYYNNSLLTNTAFMVTNTGSRTNDSLYIINFGTGAKVSKGLIGLGVSVRDIAVAIDTATLVTSLFDAPYNVKSEIKLYPNPLSDQATLEFNLDQAADVQVNVLNTLGEIILSSGIKEHSKGNQVSIIQTGSLTKGLYLIELKVNGERKSIIKGSK